MHSIVLANERSAVLPSFGRRSWIVAFLVAVSIAAGAIIALQVPRLPESGVLLPAEDPVVLVNKRIAANFGMQNPVVWVIAARDGDIWQPELLSRVRALTREVFQIPGVLAPEVVSLASPNVRDFRSSDDLLSAVYLMASVPDTPAGIEALRRRVEADPLYHGTLVSLDGRAAMIVADFRPEADGAAIAAAATALRDRHGDHKADVYVTGAPILLASAAGYRWRSLATLVVLLGIGMLVIGWAAGPKTALAIACVSGLSVLWAAAASFAFDFLLPPWVLYGVLPAALLAPAVLAGETGNRRRRAAVAAGLIVTFAGMAVSEDVAAQTFGMAAVFGTLSAFVTGGLVRERFVGNTGIVRQSIRIRPLAWALLLVAAFGVWRADVSLPLFGHGERYLPAKAAADLQGVGKHFPPPLALTVRVHGAPGFVATPEVLGAFKAWTNAVRADPAVVRAMSLTDLVEMVHRAFNDDRPELAPLPDDAPMLSRYLTLGYSPGFRRFLDRSFSQTAVWTYLSSERPADVARVRDTLSAAIAERPVPSAEVDVIGGDGAELLRVWETMRGVAGRGAFAFVIATFVVAVIAGKGTAWRFAFGGLCAGLWVAGLSGWLGLSFDLVTLPALASAIVAGAAYASLGAGVPVVASFAAVAAGASLVALAGGGGLATVAALVSSVPLVIAFSVPRWTPAG